MSYKGRKRKFHRESGQRGAMLRELTIALIERGRVKTTDARARSLRSTVEKLITRARIDSVANRRLVYSRLGNNRKATTLLFGSIAPKFKDRAGGYTRMTKLATQVRGDGRKEAIIEFVA